MWSLVVTNDISVFVVIVDAPIAIYLSAELHGCCESLLEYFLSGVVGHVDGEEARVGHGQGGISLMRHKHECVLVA
jgi:hypothetical protein